MFTNSDFDNKIVLKHSLVIHIVCCISELMLIHKTFFSKYQIADSSHINSICYNAEFMMIHEESCTVLVLLWE